MLSMVHICILNMVVQNAGYPEGYKFPGHTIYFAEVSFAKERS